MINSLLRIEKIGQQLLRGGISLYLASVAYFNFNSTISEQPISTQNVLVAGILIFIVFLLLFHYKNPKAGIVGGICCGLFFILSAFYLGVNQEQVDLSFSSKFLFGFKDILLVFASIVLTGESIKELVRKKITQPFPKN